jgi:hypothetical protein
MITSFLAKLANHRRSNFGSESLQTKGLQSGVPPPSTRRGERSCPVMALAEQAGKHVLFLQQYPIDIRKAEDIQDRIDAMEMMASFETAQTATGALYQIGLVNQCLDRIESENQSWSDTQSLRAAHRYLRSVAEFFASQGADPERIYFGYLMPQKAG